MGRCLIMETLLCAQKEYPNSALCLASWEVWIYFVSLHWQPQVSRHWYFYMCTAVSLHTEWLLSRVIPKDEELKVRSVSLLYRLTAVVLDTQPKPTPPPSRNCTLLCSMPVEKGWWMYDYNLSVPLSVLLLNMEWGTWKAILKISPEIALTDSTLFGRRGQAEKLSSVCESLTGAKFFFKCALYPRNCGIIL